MNNEAVVSSTLVFFVNGKKVVDDDVNPEWTLLYYLRNKLRLCGTKLGCAEGGCGACTVMLSKYDCANKQIIHLSANACLAPVCSMHGLSVTTVEGIGSTKTRLHPVQERIAKSHGSQCGFCTPGIVMSMYTLLRTNPKPAFKDMEIAFQGNLCRCTGYRPIIEGYRTFTEEWEQARATNGVTNGACALGDKCCKNQSNGVNGGAEDEELLFNHSEFTPLDPSQEPIFPPELQLHGKDLDAEYLIVRGERVTWYRPSTLDQIVDLKKRFNDARIVGGNSEVGVEVKFKNCWYPVLIQPMQVPELTTISVESSGLKIGASATLNEIQMAIDKQIQHQPEFKTRIFLAVTEMLHWFAGRQIRNVSAVGGNIMTGSPISDLNPIFMAAGCRLELISKDRGVRTVVMDHTFFTGYRTNVVAKDEILLSIFLPYTAENQYFHAYKQAKRREDDIAIVNAAFNVVLHPDTNQIEDIALAFGGMAITTVLAQTTRQKLIGRVWNEEMLEEAYKHLIQDLPLDASAPGGMIQYRRSLTLSFFFKAYLAICKQINKTLPKTYNGAENGLEPEIPKSSQYFAVAPPGQVASDMVGRSIQHKSAYKQATGEAVYCDDMLPLAGELYLALVLSTRAHAHIVSVDPSEALAEQGVRGFFSAKDLTEHCNKVGAVVYDEEVYATTKVTCQGQIIAAIVADNQLLAQRAAKLVKVEYKDIIPTIVTIEDAIKAQSFLHGMPKRLTKGDVAAAFASADHTLSGDIRVGGQEHFYLETHCTIAIPSVEDGEMVLHCSTQNQAETQKLVAHVLDVAMNKVVCRVKRMGGGFGGKESRCSLVALPVALAAQRLNRPVRCMLDRDQDMMITGQRHPFKANYEVAFNKDGKLQGCKITIYSNAGNSADLSPAVLERSMFHFENSYLIPNVDVTGWCCKTNLPSNTAFRGFGGPQGMLFAETMIRDIADFLGRDPLQISAMNLYKEGDKTHFNQLLEHCTLQRCWDECVQRANYDSQLAQVRDFNSHHRWKKRGISVVPTMFGISFTALFLNQAGALVHVYTDGSVLLTHGGTEMGQGLHTKMIQVASRVLGIADSYIHVAETSTDKVPNTSATAASASSDLNGMAVMYACQTIVERLAPYKAANPKGSWEQWVTAAYFDRTSLSATGFYKTPGIGYDWATNSGDPFNYFTYGAACSTVEIDCLTGDHKVLRTDIVMDLGESLNPAIDIGQVEGGFLQGYGLFTMEEPVVSPTGVLYSRGPGAYKIPGFGDIPTEFNVSLLKGAQNPRAVYSSKAVGEPPLFLAASVFFAIKDAILSARRDVGLKETFRLDSPATAASIRMACVDEITAKFPLPVGEVKPWNVAP